MRRRVLRLLAGLCVLAGVVTMVGLPASGAPDDTGGTALYPEAYLVQFGWWNKAQQTPDGGTAVPKPPTAPDNGIYIAYESSAGNVPGTVAGPLGQLPAPPTPGSNPTPQKQVLGPSAYGAVRFEAPPGAEVQVTLAILGRQSSTPGNVDPNSGPVMACVATSPWDPVQNGRYGGAPGYDCTAGTQATVAGDRLVMQVPGYLQAGRTFDLVLVPVGSEPFSMSLDAPSDASFLITNPEDLIPPEEASFEPYQAPPSDSADSFVAPEPVPSFETVDTAPLPPTTTGVTPPRRANPVVTASAPVLPAPSRTARIAAVAVLLLLAAALWWFGGQEARPPRLLGSLGAKQAALVPVGAAPRSAPARGIGRFARPRLGPAPRL